MTFLYIEGNEKNVHLFWDRKILQTVILSIK